MKKGENAGNHEMQMELVGMFFLVGGMCSRLGGDWANVKKLIAVLKTLVDLIEGVNDTTKAHTDTRPFR